MLLFGDAHQEHFRETEGSVVAVFNAAADKDGMGGGVTLKVNESASILKLATACDFGLCGSKKKVTTTSFLHWCIAIVLLAAVSLFQS